MSDSSLQLIWSPPDVLDTLRACQQHTAEPGVTVGDSAWTAK